VCTLIIGHQVLGPGTVVLAANRDEDPRRPSDPPGFLSQVPRVVGGRDRLAGGTWLALRERHAAVAMLNRRDSRGAGSAGLSTRRSRGLITLEVAGVAVTDRKNRPDLADAALARAREIVARDAYAPFSLAFLSPEVCWVLSHEPSSEPRVTPVTPGWHVLTHSDLDDRSEPRTARLLAGLDSWKPGSAEEMERGLEERLSQHGAPAVCIHEGPMVTVSASIIALGPDLARYAHAEGRPCERPLEDYSRLLAAPKRVVA
jgi:hypothetical protein